jgi:integrase
MLSEPFACVREFSPAAADFVATALRQMEVDVPISGSGLTRGRAALTQRTIDALRPEALPFRVGDERCIGLAVRVAPSGVKTWDLSYRVRGAGKVKRLSLGRVGDVSLDQARERANQLTSAARMGRDLVAEERDREALECSRVSVDGLIDVYLRRRVVGRLRTALEIERRLRRALAPHLSRVAGDLRRRDIRELLDGVADDGYLREAEKRRQTVGAMYRWALSQDLVEADPTAGLIAYPSGTSVDRTLTAEEISELWIWLESGAMPAGPTTILKLQLLTGARCGEISGMHAEEVDLHANRWVLPAERSKNKKSRTTPVIGRAREILVSELARISQGPLFVTNTGSTLRSVHIGQCLWARRERLPIAKFTTHDLRRTVATMLADMGISFEVIATVIGHEAGTRETKTLVKHYVRTDLIDRKSQVLRSWDQRVTDILTGSAAPDRVIRRAS